MKLIGKFSYQFILNQEVSSRYYKKQKFKIFIELENQSLLGKYSNQLKNIKTSLKNDLFDKSSMNNILHFTSKYLKPSKKKSNEIRSIKCGPGIKYLLNTVQ